jgi:hypothetical protein
MKGNNMLSALAKYVINRLIHGLFHIALVISPRLTWSLGANIKVSASQYIPVIQSTWNSPFFLNTYRLMHGLFHIALVISTRPWYWPRDDISRGLMTRAIWKRPCINLYYFVSKCYVGYSLVFNYIHILFLLICV